MSDIRVRPAVPAEYEVVGELTVTAYTVGGHLDDEPGYAASLRDVAGRAAGADVLVAVDDDDQVLGSVTVAAAGSPKAEVARDGEVEFRMLAVAPGAQGRGVGEALTRAVIDIARQRRAHRVVLSSRDRMTTAHCLYQRLGFVRCPERDWSPYPAIPLLAFSLDL